MEHSCAVTSTQGHSTLDTVHNSNKWKLFAGNRAFSPRASTLLLWTWLPESNSHVCKACLIFFYCLGVQSTVIHAVLNIYVHQVGQPKARKSSVIFFSHWNLLHSTEKQAWFAQELAAAVPAARGFFDSVAKRNSGLNQQLPDNQHFLYFCLWSLSVPFAHW